MKKPKHTGFDAPFLDDEEKALIETLDPARIAPDRKSADVLAEWQAAARNTQRKKSITIRIQERDIAKLKVRAIQKGMPYQTLIASILHQYAEGGLKENL